MKRLSGILAGLALLVSCGTGQAKADTLLIFGPLVNLVPQSESAPCIICATMQAHNPALFGFNNFINTGQTDAGVFWSTAQVGGSLASGVETGAIPYTVGQIGAALLDNFSFGVAIDVNSAEGQDPMTLISFQLFRVNADLSEIDRLAHYFGPTLMPDIQQGNGKADYLLSGINLSGLELGDRLIFRAEFSGGTDGGESFYLVAAPSQNEVPLPAAVWMFGGVLGVAGMIAGNRRRKQRSVWDEQKA